MKTERWTLVPGRGPIFPEELQADPDAHGGMGMHMALSIQRGIVTVPICHTGSHVSIPTSRVDAERIVADGGVDIAAEGFWCSILSPKVSVYFAGTEERVHLLRGLF